MRPSSRGIALVSVLWITLALSIIALTVMSTAKMSGQISGYVVKSSQAAAIADAGIYLMIQSLTARNAGASVPERVSTHSYNFAGNDLKVALVPESGKVDVNTPFVSLISALIEHSGGSEGDAQRAADTLRSYHSKSSNPRFQTVGDFQAVVELDTEMFACIARYLTVYSQRQSVVVDAAHQNVKDMVSWALSTHWSNRDWPLDLQSTASIGATGGLQQSGSHSGKAYTIVSSVQFADGLVSQRSAVIRITGSRSEPFWIYNWRSHNLIDDSSCSKLSDEAA